MKVLVLLSSKSNEADFAHGKQKFRLQYILVERPLTAKA